MLLFPSHRSLDLVKVWNSPEFVRRRELSVKLRGLCACFSRFSCIIMYQFFAYHSIEKTARAKTVLEEFERPMLVPRYGE